VSLRLQHALEALYGLERRRDKHDLEGTIALLRALGDPHRRFRSVHVAGTNGKGSVCALIERVLREAGYRTGLYTSPHLVDFRERIRVNGRWADEAWLERRLERIASLPEGKDPTFFEVCTALAFDYFAEQQVEIAVVEVGLGGRLDCTNVLTPEVSVITSLGLDHTELLGDTLEKIAAEKAGIIKPVVPVVVGTIERSPLAIVERIAADRGAPVSHVEPLALLEATATGQRVTIAATPWGEMILELAMVGDHQRGNAATALGTLAAFAGAGFRLPAQAVRDGFAAAHWPGRLERSPAEPRLWWDGAHNAQGIAALAASWSGAGLPAPGAAILAISQDKDLDGMLDPLAALAPGGLLVASRTRSERALEPARIADAARAAGMRAQLAPDVVTGCRMALNAAGPHAPVLLTGSLFAVGEAMEAFGGAPGEML